VRLFKLDEIARVKMEHEISRIDKSLDSVKPLLDLCKTKKPHIIEITATAQVLDLFDNSVSCRTSLAKYYVFCLFLAEVVPKLKFPNNSSAFILQWGRKCYCIIL
jgi:hypothetical protein